MKRGTIERRGIEKEEKEEKERGEGREERRGNKGRGETCNRADARMQRVVFLQQTGLARPIETFNSPEKKKAAEWAKKKERGRELRMRKRNY